MTTLADIIAKRRRADAAARDRSPPREGNPMSETPETAGDAAGGPNAAIARGTEPRRHLCVGGPRDGEWVLVHAGGKSFTAYAPRPIPSVDADGTLGAPSTLPGWVEYAAMPFVTRKGTVAVWTPRGMGRAEVLTRLIEGYRPDPAPTKPVPPSAENPASAWDRS